MPRTLIYAGLAVACAGLISTVYWSLWLVGPIIAVGWAVMSVGIWLEDRNA